MVPKRTGVASVGVFGGVVTHALERTGSVCVLNIVISLMIGSIRMVGS